ncbi:MAG: hypothetical protein Rubg2KO_41330 [Rubricoccaceae bacterium]
MLSLSSVERDAILSSLFSSNAPTGRQSIVTRFRKFWKYCASLQLPPVPSSEHRVAAYVLWLQREGKVSVKSAGQYLSAVSTVHQWLGVDFSAHSLTIGRLVQSWTLSSAPALSTDAVLAFPASVIWTLLIDAIDASDVLKVRAALVCVLSFVFFNRCDTTRSLCVDDFTEEDVFLVYREREFKRKRVESSTCRVRRFCAEHCLELFQLYNHYVALWRGAWHPDRRPTNLLRLPGEPAPTSRTVASIFNAASTFWASSWPVRMTPHSLRRGGATSAFSVGVPLQSVSHWGGWSLQSGTATTYIDFTHVASEFDGRFFAWMRSRGDEVARLFLRRPGDVATP